MRTLIRGGTIVTATDRYLGDILIDGGNSHFPDSIARTRYVESKGMLYIGTGVSGGEEGALLGPSIMPGGSAKAWPHVKEIFQAISAKVEDGSPCCDWVGSDGAGHFVKMVHNGIEYGMMQAYGEGFELLKGSDYADQFNYAEIADLWNQGSVIRSWLLELLAGAFKKDATLAGVKGYVEDSGEGRWTVLQAIESDVPAEVLALSLFRRFRSRQEDTFTDKVIAALRREFGGHAVMPTRTKAG